MRADIKELINTILSGNIPEGYRKTEFGILPMDWEYRKFEDLFIESSVFTSDTKNYPLYSLTIENGVTPKTERYEREFLITKNENNYKIVCENEFVYNPMNLRFGSLAYHSGKQKISVSGYYNVFSIAADYTPAYIKAFLLSERMMHHYDVVAIGSLKEKRRVHFSRFLQFSVPMPAVEEANKIGEFLFTWDRAIELKEKLLEQKKLQKKGLMERLLTGKVRLPGFKDEWRKIKLRDVVERVTRRNDAINTNVLTISAQRGLISQTDYFNRSVASETLDNYFLLKEGEFAYNKSYSNGYPMGAIKRLNGYSEGVVTTLYICFKLRDDTSNSDFFEQYFEAGLLNKALMKITQEGARAHGLLNIAVSDFFEMSICIPPKLEQEAIADLLVCSDSVIQKNEQEIYQLKAQKKGLMQLLLTGKVRVPC